jgi:hypothetical protein
MHNPFLYLVICLTLFSCKSQSQNTVDKVKAQTLILETLPIFSRFLTLQNEKPDSARLLSKILIAKYLEIFDADTTNKSVGDFLADCFAYRKEYEKAIYWDRHQLLRNTKELDKKVYFENLANSFLRLGKLDSSKLYFEQVFLIEKNLGYQEQIQIVANFKTFADKVYLRQDKEDIDILSKNIKSTCQYSTEILKFILPYSKDERVFIRESFDLDTINERQKNCR